SFARASEGRRARWRSPRSWAESSGEPPSPPDPPPSDPPPHTKGDSMTAREHTTPIPASKAGLIARPGQAGIDPRGPRFGAGITSLLLLVTIGLSLGTAATPPPNIVGRAAQPGFILLEIITVLFAWGAFAGVQKHPYGRLFAAVVRPHLAAPVHLEDPT